MPKRFIPNALTILRIVVTPLLLLLLLQETFVSQAWGLVLFVLAAISDYLDGKLARTYGVGSRLGRFLDPLADKILVLGTFAVLAYLLPAGVPWWVVGIIAARDVVVTVLRTRLEAQGRSLRTLPAAKWKTAAQLTFLIATLVFLAASKLPGLPGRVGGAIVTSPAVLVGALVVAAVTVYTGFVYLTQQEEVPEPSPEGPPGASGRSSERSSSS